jgi:Fe2+ transport system protein B
MDVSEMANSVVHQAEVEEAVTTILTTDQSTLQAVIVEDSSTTLLLSAALVGTPRVGKSSLFSTLLNHSQIERSKESASQIIRRGDWVKTIRLVDGPDYCPDHPDSIERVAEVLSEADIIVQVYNIDAMVRRTDRRLTAFILGFDKPWIAVLNKVHFYSQSPNYQALVAKVEKSIGHEVICVSTKTGEGLAELMTSVVCVGRTGLRLDLFLRLKRIAQRIKVYELEEHKRISRNSACQRIVNKHIKEAAEVGASGDPSAAVILAIQRVMIDSIAEQFSEVDANISSYTLDSKLDFLLNSITQEFKRIPGGQSLTSVHAMSWTNDIGQLAIQYFESQLADEILTSKVSKLVEDFD